MNPPNLICYFIALWASLACLLLIRLAFTGFKHSSRPLKSKLAILAFSAFSLLVAIAAYKAATALGSY